MSAAPSTDAVRIRYAVRALLFNPRGELLLIQYRGNPDLYQTGRQPVTAPHWGTAGGGIDAGEDVTAALHREIMEEIGHDGITIGREVWHRRADMVRHGAPFRLDERYFMATTPHDFIRSEDRTATERSYVLDTRWWNIDALIKTEEIILPPFLQHEIAALAAGHLPAAPRMFDETN